MAWQAAIGPFDTEEAAKKWYAKLKKARVLPNPLPGKRSPGDPLFRGMIGAEIEDVQRSNVVNLADTLADLSNLHAGERAQPTQG